MFSSNSSATQQKKIDNTQEFAVIVSWIGKIREQKVRLEIDAENDDRDSAAKLKAEVFQKLLKELDDIVGQYNQQQQNGDTQVAEQVKCHLVSEVLMCAEKSYVNDHAILASQRGTVNGQVKAVAATAAYVAPFVACATIPATWLGAGLSTWFFAGPVGRTAARGVMKLPEPTTYSLKLIAGLINELSKIEHTLLGNLNNQIRSKQNRDQTGASPR